MCTALGVGIVALGLWGTGTLAGPTLHEAEYQLMRRDHGEVLDRLDAAERLNGDAAEIAWMRARIARRRGDARAMQRHLQTALAAGLDRSRADRERVLAKAQSGELESVYDELVRWMKNPGNNAADIADAYVLGLRSVGRLAEAKLIVTTWAADCPFDPKASVEMGRIAESEFRKQDAHQAYRQAVETNPDYPAGLFALGQWLLSQKQPAEALPFLDRCVAADAMTAPAVDPFRARCHRLLGQPEKARQLLQASLTANTMDVDKAFVRLSLKPRRGLAEFERGMLAFDAGRFEAAAESFELALQQAPQMDDAEYQLGLTLKRLGQQERGDALLERVTARRAEFAKLNAYAFRIADEPDNFDARYRMGVLLLDNGRHASGLFHLKCALAIEPGHVAAHEKLAQFYEQHRDEDPSYERLARVHRSVLADLLSSDP